MFFELINMQQEKMKLSINCAKESKSMYAIYNNAQ